jgi:hypothetical protein
VWRRGRHNVLAGCGVRRMAGMTSGCQQSVRRNAYVGTKME